MPNLMERKSTRRVENGAAQPTSVINKSVNWRNIAITLIWPWGHLSEIAWLRKLCKPSYSAVSPPGTEC